MYLKDHLNLNKLLGIVLALYLLAGIASASYAGDDPLTLVFDKQQKGDFMFTAGNSTYSGQMNPGDEYVASFSVTIPEDGTVAFERVYVYWAWSKCDQSAIYPTISLQSPTLTNISFQMNARYADSKGFVSSNDFFSGMDAYDGDFLHAGDNDFILTVTNSAEDNCTFVIQGIGVLAVYESDSCPDGRIWVNEGCDMLYNSYGITPEMATGITRFEGEIDKTRLKSARLELVAPSGGYTRLDVPKKNAIYFNYKDDGNLPDFLDTIFNMLFPGYNGKVWIDAFDSDEIMQVGTDVRDVTPYIREKDNVVEVEDRGDYLLFTNAILRIDEV